MSATYRVLIFDEFNWEYVDFPRDEVVNQVQSIFPHAELEADIYQMMIFDIDHSDPRELRDKVVCTHIFAKNSEISGEIVNLEAMK